MNAAIFAEYARDKLDADVLVPDFDKPDEQAFAAALESFRALSAWTHGAVNARGDTLSLSAGYIEKMTPNAFAALSGDHHVIGMHSALPVTMIEFALFIFTQADQFEEVGNATAESSPFYGADDGPGLYLLKMTLAGGTVQTERDQSRVPKDADRHIMAVYLAMLMMRFVWMHELAHVMRGHVALLRDRGATSGLTELAEAAPLVGFGKADAAPPVSASIRRAMELDADKTALWGCCQVQFMGGENLPAIAALDVATRLRLTLYAAYAMTWLFDLYETFLQSAGGVTHPKPSERLNHLVAFTAAEIGQGIEGFDQFHDDLCERFNRLSRAIPLLHKITPPVQSPADAAALADLETAIAPYQFEPVSP